MSVMFSEEWSHRRAESPRRPSGGGVRLNMIPKLTAGTRLKGDVSFLGDPSAVVPQGGPVDARSWSSDRDLQAGNALVEHPRS